MHKKVINRKMYNTTHTEHKDFPPCQIACPILTDAREYVQFIAERRFEEAFASIRKLNPLPRVCGRICVHPCEIACKRGQIEEPISIASLKRFASDGPWANHYKVTLPEKSTGYKVAVVGSGPAALSAAHDLALLGHHVTIFEKLPLLGGMMAVGIPRYRIPRDILSADIKAIEDLGVEMKTCVTFGQDITIKSLKDDGYHAVFLATGLHLSRRLNVEGEDLAGVLKGVDFLRHVALGESVAVGKRVIVIGGGNVAIDVARTALRVGAQDVSMVCLEKQEEMPASVSEIDEAREEGIAILNCYGPKRFLEENGKLSGVEFKICTCLFDEKGAFCPRYDETQLTEIEADTVIVAIGQAADLSFIKMDNIAVTERGGLKADPTTLQMPISGVFAGGDAVTGPATAIKAIAAGKKAAISIDLFLRGESLPTAKQSEMPETRRLPERIVEKAKSMPRCKAQTLSAESRLPNFDEVATGFTEIEAIQEAQRCLHCNLGARLNHELCIGCGTCAKVCPLEIPSVDADGRADIDIFQCQACGTCVAECPVQAIDINLCPRGYIVCEVEKGLRQSQIDDSFTVGLFSQYGNFTSNHLDALGRDFPQVVPVMIFGMERVSISDLLRTFQLGADGILMAEAPEEKPPFPGTRSLIEKRSGIAKEILKLLGLGEERLILYTMPKEGLFEESWLARTIEGIRSLGPNPLRKGAGTA